MHLDLAGRDPDDGVTRIPYEKGALLVRFLEQKYGREKFDLFLKGYFDHFAFQSITTAQAIDYLKANLDPSLDMNAWVYQPGLPADAPRPTSEAFAKVDSAVSLWSASNKFARIPSDYNLFVRLHHANGNCTVGRRDQALAAFVQSGINRDPQPLHIRADPVAHHGRVLTDPAGEY
jgi:leukotriene-A4 hydrolase